MSSWLHSLSAHVSTEACPAVLTTLPVSSRLYWDMSSWLHSLSAHVSTETCLAVLTTLSVSSRLYWDMSSCADHTPCQLTSHWHLNRDMSSCADYTLCQLTSHWHLNRDMSSCSDHTLCQLTSGCCHYWGAVSGGGLQERWELYLDIHTERGPVCLPTCWMRGSPDEMQTCLGLK